jgi:hypothetical protein
VRTALSAVPTADAGVAAGRERAATAPATARRDLVRMRVPLS